MPGTVMYLASSLLWGFFYSHETSRIRPHRSRPAGAPAIAPAGPQSEPPAQWAIPTGSRLSASHCRGVRRMHPVCHTSSCERAPAVRLPSCLRMAHCFAQKGTPAVIRRSARISQLINLSLIDPAKSGSIDQNRFIFRRIARRKKATTSPVVNFVRNPSMERPLFFPQ